MIRYRPSYLGTLFVLLLLSCATRQEERIRNGRAYAEQELQEALAGMQQSNVADGKTMIITDSVTAVQIAEPVLFSIYGKDNITLQQPYEIYLIDHYWVISGTLPEEKVGGVFLFILDANDGKIMRITHGK